MTTTQQTERPLSEVDEAAERLQAGPPHGWDEPTADRPSTGERPSTDERPAWDAERALEIVQRVARDPASLLRGTIVAVSLVVIVAAIRSRRRPPRSAEELLLERSREAFDHARETLESIASRLSSIDR
jgi:hypothetical protein